MIRLARPEIGDDELAAVNRVLRSGMLVQGKECAQFEKELAEYLGVSHVVVVSSGTAALHLSLIAHDIGSGDAVIIPDFTFPATANVVECVGARPVLIDVDPSTYDMTDAGLEAALKNYDGREKIRAVMPVHQFGCPADISAIIQIARENDLLVIEDAACALGGSHNGKKIGGFGDCACFSFHPRKIITTGEGGAIATNNPELAVKLRQLRNHGIESTNHGQDFIRYGLNYRMTEFQAALGRMQLKRIDEFIEKRKVIHKIYQRRLRDSQIDLPEAVDGHTWQTFMVTLPDHIDRDQIIHHLKEKEIETNLGAYAVHTLEYYRRKYPEDAERLDKSHSLRLYKQGLALPLHSQMTKEQAHEVADALIDAVA